MLLTKQAVSRIILPTNLPFFVDFTLMLAEKKNLFFTQDMNFLLSKSAGENGLADLITDYDREKDFL